MRWLACALTLAASAGVSPSNQDQDKPMSRFESLVGKWRVQHTLSREAGQPPEVFEGTAEIYFVSDGAVLVVDERTPDNRYRFVGYHTYQASSGKYINWTASSRVVLAWGEGEWDKSREIFRTRRLDPSTGILDPLVGKGVWELVDANKHVFKALRIQPDGVEIPFKEEIYTRLPNEGVSNKERQRTRPAQAMKPRR